VIVNVGVGRIVLDRLLERFSRFLHIALLHVYACNLDPALGKRWNQLQRFLEVSLGTIGISHKEPGGMFGLGTMQEMEEEPT
jgi:hypothetical protein